MAEDKRQRASDILAQEQQFDADWGLDDVRTDFAITGFESIETGAGDAYLVDTERDGQPHRWVTWSRVVGDQLQRLEPHFPVVARVEMVRGKQGFYYTLV